MYNIDKDMAQTRRLIISVMSKAFQENGIIISPEQFIILKIIDANDDIIQQDIAVFLQKDKSAVMRMVNKLQGMKLLARVPNENDKRKYHVLITKQGLHEFEKAEMIHTEVLSKLMINVQKDEIEIMQNLLGKIQTNAKEILNS